jgi:predicted dehydrogenase
MNALGTNPTENTDNVSILLKYQNGTNAAIHYFSNGSKAYSKERIEVYSQERTLVLDNWKSLKTYGFKGFSGMKGRQDKGHKMQFSLFHDRITRGGEALIPFDSIVNTTRTSFACIESMKNKTWIEI